MCIEFQSRQHWKTTVFKKTTIDELKLHLDVSLVSTGP